MKNAKLDIRDVLNTASKSRQLNALLQNIFEKGADGCNPDNELLGLAYDISNVITRFMDRLEREEDK